MKKVLLERFPPVAINIFQQQLKHLIDIKIVVFQSKQTILTHQNIEFLDSLSVSKRCSHPFISLVCRQ